MPTVANNGEIHKPWISFNFENSISVIHEGLPGIPSRYRIRLRMDQGYKLADLRCTWHTPAADKQQQQQRLLKLSASARNVASNKAVKANKSFEILVEPMCHVAPGVNPTLTTQPSKEECWIEFNVDSLPKDLPLAKA
ncbi:hypothetical protein BOX15_Mlig004643g1 [Macrostomum lignano]|uniref:Uncharacterized protein n=1 Tax=Macrostomum lignano TaxID=282301 RepID=A0A267GGX4_9PLAT|nr:hypothetical protein BOX15_Mlig004643g2 [Macrostomum lignano]PAA85288.1 hypothetical protein BOX15_Mlig004643g1 [Macrostomum lignano]